MGHGSPPARIPTVGTAALPVSWRRGTARARPTRRGGRKTRSRSNCNAYCRAFSAIARRSSSCRSSTASSMPAAMASVQPTGMMPAVSPTASGMPPVAVVMIGPAAGEHLLDERDAERLDELGLRLARQHERRAARHERPLLGVVDVVEEQDPVGDRRRGGPRAHAPPAPGRCRRSRGARRRAARDRGVAVDEVVDALLGADPGEEEHVAVALEAAAGERRADLVRRSGSRTAAVDGRVGDADPLAALRRERRAPAGVDLVGGLDDAVLGVLATRRRSGRGRGTR